MSFALSPIVIQPQIGVLRIFVRGEKNLIALDWVTEKLFICVVREKSETHLACKKFFLSFGVSSGLNSPARQWSKELSTSSLEKPAKLSAVVFSRKQFFSLHHNDKIIINCDIFIGSASERKKERFLLASRCSSPFNLQRSWTKEIKLSRLKKSLKDKLYIILFVFPRRWGATIANFEMMENIIPYHRSWCGCAGIN